MIKLSKRLDAIANLIDKEDIVIDIGCDHALMTISLALKNNKTYYASDLRESALDMARENIKKYKCTNVLLTCKNGLEALSISNDIDTIVISGMGHYTITKMLENIDKRIKKIVIQSNTNQEIIRKFMVKKGFYIDKEVVVKDKNIYYVITSFKVGKKKYKPYELEIGVFDNKLSTDYIKDEINKCILLLKIVPKNELLRRFKIKKRLKFLKKFYEK